MRPVQTGRNFGSYHLRVGFAV